MNVPTSGSSSGSSGSSSTSSSGSGDSEKGFREIENLGDEGEKRSTDE